MMGNLKRILQNPETLTPRVLRMAPDKIVAQSHLRLSLSYLSVFNRTESLAIIIRERSALFDVKKIPHKEQLRVPFKLQRVTNLRESDIGRFILPTFLHRAKSYSSQLLALCKTRTTHVQRKTKHFCAFDRPKRIYIFHGLKDLPKYRHPLPSLLCRDSNLSRKSLALIATKTTKTKPAFQDMYSFGQDRKANIKANVSLLQDLLLLNPFKRQ